MKNLPLIVISFVVAGCVATPNLEYRKPGPDLAGYMKFTLPQSIVTFQALPGGSITAASVPDDDYSDALKYSLMADAQWSLWTSSTVTKWEYVDGQNVVKSIATTAESNVSKLLDVAKDVVGFAASTSAGQVSFQNDMIDPFTDENGARVRLPADVPSPCTLSRNPGWQCEIIVEKHPVWSISFIDFEALILTGDAKKVFPSSSCVKATITLTAPPTEISKKTSSDVGNAKTWTAKADGTISSKDDATINQPEIAAVPTAEKKFVFTVELADPTYVNLIRLRRGGELQASGPCRYNVTNDKAVGNLDTQAFKDALALAKAIKAAKKSAKK